MPKSHTTTVQQARLDSPTTTLLRVIGSFSCGVIATVFFIMAYLAFADSVIVPGLLGTAIAIYAAWVATIYARLWCGAATSEGIEIQRFNTRCRYRCEDVVGIFEFFGRRLDFTRVRLENPPRTVWFAKAYFFAKKGRPDSPGARLATVCRLQLQRRWKCYGCSWRARGARRTRIGGDRVAAAKARCHTPSRRVVCTSDPQRPKHSAKCCVASGSRSGSQLSGAK